MMQLGCDGVFVGSGICESNLIRHIRRMLMVVLSGDPAKRARAIVQAVTHYNNPAVLAEISTDLGDAMVGIST